MTPGDTVEETMERPPERNRPIQTAARLFAEEIPKVMTRRPLVMTNGFLRPKLSDKGGTMIELRSSPIKGLVDGRTSQHDEYCA